jgi:hypothetical protein
MSSKPAVSGLKDPVHGWFYVAGCPKCDWSVNWDGEMPFEWVVEVALWHWWIYSDTVSCYRGS